MDQFHHYRIDICHEFENVDAFKNKKYICGENKQPSTSAYLNIEYRSVTPFEHYCQDKWL